MSSAVGGFLSTYSELLAGGFADTLLMNKTKNWRGAFCFPWVDASFFNAQAEALLAEADAPALAEADRMSVVGEGGGNVTKSYGNIVSIAQKFGLRKEEIPVLVKVARFWNTCSVEVKTQEYSELIPEYYKYKAYRDSVLVMFGRTVNNRGKGLTDAFRFSQLRVFRK